MELANINKEILRFLSEVPYTKGENLFFISMETRTIKELFPDLTRNQRMLLGEHLAKTLLCAVIRVVEDSNLVRSYPEPVHDIITTQAIKLFGNGRG